MIYESPEVLIAALFVWLPLITAALAFAWWKRGPLVAKGAVALFAMLVFAGVFIPLPWVFLAVPLFPIALVLVRSRRSFRHLADAELDDAQPKDIPGDIDRIMWSFGTLGFEPPIYTTAQFARSTSVRADLVHNSRGARAYVAWVPGWHRASCGVASRFAAGGLITTNHRSVLDPPEGMLQQVVVPGSPEDLVGSHANALAFLAGRGLTAVELPAEPPRDLMLHELRRIVAWHAEAPSRRTFQHIWRSRRAQSAATSLLAAQPGIEARIAALVAMQPAPDADAPG
jgi:hypothetical protein